MVLLEQSGNILIQLIHILFFFKYSQFGHSSQMSDLVFCFVFLFFIFEVFGDKQSNDGAG